MRIKNYAKFYAWPYNVINVRSTRPKRTVVATELLWEISTEYAVSAQQWQSAGSGKQHALSLPLSAGSLVRSLLLTVCPLLVALTAM